MAGNWTSSRGTLVDLEAFVGDNCRPLDSVGRLSMGASYCFVKGASRLEGFGRARSGVVT